MEESEIKPVINELKNKTAVGIVRLFNLKIFKIVYL